MESISELLFILSIVLIVVLLFLHKSIPEKSEPKELYADKENINIKECTSSICQSMIEIKKGIDNTLEIVSRKPSDYNDKQVLTKYNKGTYRNEKGRYASLDKA